MPNSLDIAFGRYWWILNVHENASGEVCACVTRVLRGRRTCVVDITFEGSLAECRNFQVQNGAAADGVLLLDNVSPVKMVTAGEGLDASESVSDFVGFKREDFDVVNSLDGKFAVLARHRAIENLVDEVAKVGFRILTHVPAMLVETTVLCSREMLDSTNIFTSFVDGVSKIWLFSAGEVLAFYQISDAQDKCAELVKFIKNRYVLGEVTVEEASLDEASLAKTVAEDAWLFHTDHLPSFRSLPNRRAMARIREAALFRRVFKACLGVGLISLLVTLSFWGGVAWYSSKSQTQIASFEKQIETRKELERVWKKLEADKAQTEVFLSHRSRVASALAVVASDIPGDLWVTHWSVSRGVHSMQGYAATSEDVSKFLSTLESEKSLVNVRLRTTEKTTWKKHNVVKFDLSMEEVR